MLLMLLLLIPTKSLLANVLSTFLIKGKPVFSNGPKSLPNNHPDSPILCN